MRVLLDTHAFIWWDGASRRLSPRVKALCSDPANELFLSVASLWEMQIKSLVGKLALRMPLPDLVEEQRRLNALTIVPVHAQHVFELDTLPRIHKDPFDRMLVAQARVEELRLVSHDPVMREYGVDIIW